ncbi:MAG: hypothetical protein E6R13_02610 [Spirochaetes bacterium]|nr:MAG: hypothetical protein E6R13_02610 [Spirochaetota bacterium]
MYNFYFFMKQVYEFDFPDDFIDLVSDEAGYQEFLDEEHVKDFLGDGAREEAENFVRDIKEKEGYKFVRADTLFDEKANDVVGFSVIYIAAKFIKNKESRDILIKKQISSLLFNIYSESLRGKLTREAEEKASSLSSISNITIS